MYSFLENVLEKNACSVTAEQCSCPPNVRYISKQMGVLLALNSVVDDLELLIPRERTKVVRLTELSSLPLLLSLNQQNVSVSYKKCFPLYLAILLYVKLVQNSVSLPVSQDSNSNNYLLNSNTACPSMECGPGLQVYSETFPGSLFSIAFLSCLFALDVLGEGSSEYVAQDE